MRTSGLVDHVSETQHEGSDAIFNVVIAYDNITAAWRAMRICSNLTKDQAGQLTIRPHPWRFDLIVDPDWREIATGELLMADLLILSAASQRQLPATIQSWLTTCLLCNRGAPGAVLVLLGPETDLEDVNSPNLWFIKNVVNKAGIELFAPPSRLESFAHPTRGGDSITLRA